MRYDPRTQTYEIDGQKVDRLALLLALGISNPDLARNMLAGFERIYKDLKGVDISPNELHVCFMRYMSDRILPQWMFEAYKSRTAQIHQLIIPKSKP